MRIMIVGQADSIFFKYYTQYLKMNNLSIEVDIFSIDKYNNNYDLSHCDNIYSVDWNNSYFSKIKFIRNIVHPFFIWFKLVSFLKKQNKVYDVIHFKWLVPSVIILPSFIKKYCFKTIATFWGSELETLNIFQSKKLYKFVLVNFLKKIDFITYSTEELKTDIINLSIDINKLYYAVYGSNIYQEIEKLRKNINKNEAKEIIGISKQKLTITVGYSGKKLHQHIKIINSCLSNQQFINIKDKLVILIPATYGANDIYLKEITCLLDSYQINYRLFTEKMSEYEVAVLRCATDIALQLSISDGRSSSIIEFIQAGAVLISGSWLPYKVFKENQIHFHEVKNIERDLPLKVVDIVTYFDTEKEKAELNISKWKFETWPYAMNNWLRLYNSLIEN